MAYHRKTTRVRSPEHCRRISEARQTGTYFTPWGTYSTATEATNYIDLNIAPSTVIAMCCRNDRTIDEQRYRRNSFLHTIGNWTIGKTYRQIGFSFEPKQKAK